MAHVCHLHVAVKNTLAQNIWTHSLDPLSQMCMLLCLSIIINMAVKCDLA